MKNYILFDDGRENLLPLTFLRPVSDLRVGVLTLKERWELMLDSPSSWYTADYLSAKYPTIIKEDNYFVNASILPEENLIRSVSELNFGQTLVKANIILAARFDSKMAENFTNNISKALNIVQFRGEIAKINFLWDIFQLNDKVIEFDFQLLTKNRKSEKISSTNILFNKEKIFVEEGAKIEYASLNASNGPIYIGKNAEVMEGCLIRGPFALCDNSTLKMGTKIYGATTIGPNSKVGGEVNNCVIFANSNKAHDGFLGNSVLGEWCNLGADTNNSNLKNNYSEVKLWNYSQKKFIHTGLQFCGLIMGDHSKCGINTMFNTGTVIGISANIFGAGYPRNFIPSFSWGGPQGLSVYPLDKALETAEKVMQRRHNELTHVDKKIMEHVFISTDKFI